MKSSAYGNVQNIFLVLLSENKISVYFSVFAFFSQFSCSSDTSNPIHMLCIFSTFHFHFTLLQISHISFLLHIVANIPHFISSSHCCIYCLLFLSGKFPIKKEAPYGESVSEPFFHKVLLQFTSCFSSYSGLQPSKSLSLNQS